MIDTNLKDAQKHLALQADALPYAERVKFFMEMATFARHEALRIPNEADR